MTQVAFKKSGFPEEPVIGMAGVLDAARDAHISRRCAQCLGRKCDGVRPRRTRRIRWCRCRVIRPVRASR
jgi:hypothetical protein